jgi:peptidoglycan/LPS O-acetylase OafA/YrhL
MLAKVPANAQIISMEHGDGRMERKVYYSTLDLLRGIAAFFVVFQHSRNMFFVDYAEAHKHSLFIKAFYLLSDFGHQAVVVFFVLSGCVVGRIPIVSSRKGGWSWEKYLFDRLTRLWVVLVPGLLLTLVWDYLNLRFANDQSFVFGGTMGHSLHGPLTANLGIAHFFGNLFFLQTIIVGTFGSNSPLWSLANEFWYYLLFPLLFRALYVKNNVSRVIHIALGIVGLFFVGKEISVLFLVWLLGAAVFRLHERYNSFRHIRALFAAALILNIGDLMWIRLNDATINTIMADIFLGLSVSILIYAALCINLPGALRSIGSFFARFSFSLYVLHMPVLAFIAGVLIQKNEHRKQPDLRMFALYFCMILLVYGYSFTVYWFTERKTNQVRDWFDGVFNSIRNNAKPVK